MKAGKNILIQTLTGSIGIFLLVGVGAIKDSTQSSASDTNVAPVNAIDDFDQWPLHHGRLVVTSKSRKLFEDTGVRIAYPERTYDSGGWTYEAGQLDDTMVTQISEAISSYETTFVKQNSLDWIVLTPGLYYEDREVGTSISDTTKTLWINTRRAASDGGIASFVHYGVYRMALNIRSPLPGPEYHGNAYVSRAWGTASDPCFTSNYAGYSGAADRGEIYRFLMTAPDRLESRASASPCLRAKVDQVLSEIESRAPELQGL